MLSTMSACKEKETFVCRRRQQTAETDAALSLSLSSHECAAKRSASRLSRSIKYRAMEAGAAPPTRVAKSR